MKDFLYLSTPTRVTIVKFLQTSKTVNFFQYRTKRQVNSGRVTRVQVASLKVQRSVIKII